MKSLILTDDPREALQIASQRKTNRAALPDGFEDTYCGAMMTPRSEVPILLLHHGRATYKPTYWSGHAVDHENRSWAYRCLVAVQGVRATSIDLGGDGGAPTEFRDLWGDWFYLAGVWVTWGPYSFENAGFALLSGPGEPNSRFQRSLLVVPRNFAEDWLNPTKDSRYLVHQFDRLELAESNIATAA